MRRKLIWMVLSFFLTMSVIQANAKEFDVDLLATGQISAQLAESPSNITVLNFMQTENGTTTNSIGMQWDPVEGAIEYYIFQDYVTDVSNPAYKSQTNSYVVENASTGWHKYLVMAVGTNGMYLINLGCSNVVEMKIASAIPNDVSGFDVGYNNSSEMVAIWNEQGDCDAYEIVAYDKNGIAVDQQEVKPINYMQNGTKLNCPMGKLYQVRVRAVNKNWNGELSNGEWSKVMYLCVPKGYKTKLKSSTGKTVITSWKKVPGVSSYVLSGSTKKNSGYKTIKKVKMKSKMKVTYNKIKGKKFKYGKYYYVRLRMKAKVKLDGRRVEKNFDAFRSFQITPGY